MTTRGERSTVASRLDYSAMIVIAVFLFSTPRADAAVIDFGTSVIEDFNPGDVYGEDGFAFLVVSGTTFAILGDDGNPASGLAAGFPFPVGIGDTISVTRQGGGLFTFDAFDFASISELLSSHAVNLFGRVNGVQTEQRLGVASVTEVFLTSDPLFLNPIDELLIVGAAQANVALILVSCNSDSHNKSCMRDGRPLSKSGDAGEDLVGRLGPHKRLGVLIMDVEERPDRAL
jgi:hypothetical protein